MHPKVAYIRALFYRWLRRALLGILVTALLTAAVALYRYTRPTLPVVDYKALETAEVRASVDPAWAAVGGDALAEWDRAAEIIGDVRTAYREGNPDDPWSWRRFPNFSEHDPPAAGEPDPDEPGLGDLLEAMDLLERAGLLDALDSIASSGMLVSTFEPGSLMFTRRNWRVGHGRSFINLSIFRMEWMLRVGEIAEGCRSLEHIRAVIRHTESNAGIVNYLVALAERAVFAHNIRRVLDSEISVDGNGGLLLLDEILLAGDIPQMHRYLEHERNGMLELWQEAYTGEPETPDYNGVSIEPWSVKLLGSHKKTVEWVNRFFDALVLWSRRSLRERTVTVDELYASIDGSPDWIGVPLRGIIPTYPRAAMLRETVGCEWNGTILMAAIEVHHANHSKLPESLDDLVPGILHKLPPDPFAPDAGFIYRRLGDTGEYLLYSVGYDQTDDGGNPAADKEHDALNGDCPHSDFILHDGRGEARLLESLQ